MSTFRRIDSLLDGKTSDQLASEVAARARERAEKDQRSSHRPPSAPVDLRPLVVRTSGSVTEGIYGLVLTGHRRCLLAGTRLRVRARPRHVAETRLTRAEFVRSLRENWSLIEVVIPLLLVLGLGEVDLITDTAAIVAATVIAALELAAGGGYAAVRHGARPRGVIASAASGLTLGLLVVLLKALAFMH
jgi:hypothetical protein